MNSTSDQRNTDPVVRVRNLSKTFIREGGESVRAIDDVSFDVPSGEFTVLLGPSGCGKTTLLRAIAGLEEPNEGTIELHGKAVFSSSEGVNIPPDSRRISMVFQSYALWPHMSAFDNVAYPLQVFRRSQIPKNQISERVHHVLELVGIPNLDEQYPGQMSGGQQQRVALARALVPGTDLVLFDEPLSNVDAKVREQLRLELLEMQTELGFAALFVTHDQAEAMILADRIAVLSQGRIVQFGPPQDVYYAPNSRYVANFIGSTNEIAGSVVSIDEADRCVVESADEFIFGVAGSPGLSVGDAVVAVWRPEQLSMQASNPGMDNSWRGTVGASLFLGSHTEVLVETPNHQLRVWSPVIAEFPAGEEVWVSVPIENVRVLRASED